MRETSEVFGLRVRWGTLASSTKVVMLSMGSSNRPILTAGFSLPSYSNFESMICRELHRCGIHKTIPIAYERDDLMRSRFSDGAGLTDLARKTGKKSLKGSAISCHPSFVSKLLKEKRLSKGRGIER